MEIIYQTLLSKNPTIKPTMGVMAASNYSFNLEPLTIDEIISLETAYNSGSQFPASLRELLFLAGQSCYVLDYGRFDTQEEMQEGARNWLADYGFSITRPFFVIDVYNGGDTFLFVYLDEGTNDPMVYQSNLDTNLNPRYSWLTMLKFNLSAYINSGISSLVSGRNPF